MVAHALLAHWLYATPESVSREDALVAWAVSGGDVGCSNLSWTG